MTEGQDYRRDEEFAASLASAAGRLLIVLRDTGVLSGKELGAAGDAVSQRFLSAALATHRPSDSVLSEEAADDEARLERDRVWIIDPLDGTREYGEGREDWAVHVALSQGGEPGPSAVALPQRGAVVSGVPGADAGKELPPLRSGALRIAVSRTRPPAEAQRVAESLGAELVPLGSAGFKVLAVVSGEVDAYVHSGGQYEWDSAAPVGVALAAGFHASRLDGSRLRYNRRDPSLPDLLVCRPDLSRPILAALSSATS